MTLAKSSTTGRDVGYRALLASGTRTSTRTSETPYLSFFKTTATGRDSGYRALLASGGRSPEERETLFFGSQMRVKRSCACLLAGVYMCVARKGEEERAWTHTPEYFEV